MRQLQQEETTEKASWFGRRFGRKHIRENAEAVSDGVPEIVPLKTEAFNTLTAEFIRAARVDKRNFRIAVGGAIIGFSITLISALPVLFIKHFGSAFGLPLAFSDTNIQAGGMLLLMASGLFMIYSAARTRGIANKLSNTEDLRVVGPLAEGLELRDSYSQLTAVDALTRLLPRLQGSDTSLLNDAQRACLYRRLYSIGQIAQKKMDSFSADFVVAVLKALEQVGDAKALPSVQRLAEMKAKTPEQERVRDAALACLPFLQARADQQRAEETLLRAAGVSETPPEVLLRAASGGSAAGTETLLRPGASPEETGDKKETLPGR